MSIQSSLRSVSFFSQFHRALDGTRGPLTESHLWHRRQKHLIGITEQLKTKECKGVIAILITGKSKILKKWKFIDTRFAMAASYVSGT